MSSQVDDCKCTLDLVDFFAKFQDFLAPKLDTYEQAIYLYVFRHSWFVGKDKVTTGFKSERARLAMGVGEHDRPMSESSCQKKLRSLEQKGFVKVLDIHRAGRVLRLLLPSEIPGLVPADVPAASVDIEIMDFYNDQSNRALLLEREEHRCFYTLAKLDKENFSIDHVVARENGGDNSYRNCVAASRKANTEKGTRSADDYLRTLWRERRLNDSEFDDRLKALDELKAGLLKPDLQ